MDLAVSQNIKISHLHLTSERIDHIEIAAVFEDNTSAGLIPWREANQPVLLPILGIRYPDGQYMQSLDMRRTVRWVGHKALIEHFIVLFHRSKIDRISLRRAVLDSEQLANMHIPIGEFRLCTDGLLYDEVIRSISILKSEKLHITCNHNSFEDRQMHELLGRNLTGVEFSKMEKSSLWMTNATHIRTLVCIKSHLLNEFLKHWIQGSNPRMKYLQTSVQLEMEECKSKIFQGINVSIEEDAIMIKSLRGTLARITLKVVRQEVSIRMVVQTTPF